MFFVPYKFAGNGNDSVFIPLIKVEAYVVPLAKPKSMPHVEFPKILKVVFGDVITNLPVVVENATLILLGNTLFKYAIKLLAL
jgi:hypothetical protein